MDCAQTKGRNLFPLAAPARAILSEWFLKRGFFLACARIHGCFLLRPEKGPEKMEGLRREFIFRNPWLA